MFAYLAPIFKYFCFQIQYSNFFCYLTICLNSIDNDLIIVNQIICYNKIVVDDALLSFLII
jgi:hypothetical protein